MAGCSCGTPATAKLQGLIDNPADIDPQARAGCWPTPLARGRRLLASLPFTNNYANFLSSATISGQGIDFSQISLITKTTAFSFHDGKWAGCLMPSSLDLAIQQIGAALADVAAIVDRPDGPADLLALLGWDLPPGAQDIGLSALDFTALVNAVENLKAGIAAGTSGSELDAAYVQVGVALGSFLQGIDTIVNDFAAAGDYLTQTDIVQQFIPRLLDYSCPALQTTRCCRSGCSCSRHRRAAVPYAADPPSTRSGTYVRRALGSRPQSVRRHQGLLARRSSGASPAPTRSARRGARHDYRRAGRDLRPGRYPGAPRPALVGQDVPEADTDPMLQVMLSILKALDDSASTWASA